MPIFVRVDSDSRTVLSVAEGVIARDDIRAHQDAITADPAFEADFNHLFDLRGVTKVTFDFSDMANLVRRNPFGVGARRAYVAGGDAVLGMARMAQALYEEGRGETRVFTDIDEARHWLGLE